MKPAHEPRYDFRQKSAQMKERTCTGQDRTAVVTRLKLRVHYAERWRERLAVALSEAEAAYRHACDAVTRERAELERLRARPPVSDTADTRTIRLR